jgi:hypothetical protein
VVGGQRHAPAALYVCMGVCICMYIYISYVTHACTKLSVYLLLLYMTNSLMRSEECGSYR